MLQLSAQQVDGKKKKSTMHFSSWARVLQSADLSSVQKKMAEQSTPIEEWKYEHYLYSYYKKGQEKAMVIWRTETITLGLHKHLHRQHANTTQSDVKVIAVYAVSWLQPSSQNVIFNR